jgi:hypothetical protein
MEQSVTAVGWPKKKITVDQSVALLQTVHFLGGRTILPLWVRISK